MPPTRTIVCCTPFGDDWTWFVQHLTAPGVRWIFTSDKPTRPWQRHFQHPNLITPFATLRTALTARRTRAALLITVDPRLSFWCALWCRLLGVRIEHFVFSFNFPELPRGAKLPVFRFAFQQLAQLRVHSTMERGLYARHFGIPPERIRVALWAMNEPEIEPGTPLEPGDYLSAVGGNARDYRTLAAAARLLPAIPQVWVVRPENLAGIDLPPNVRVVSNISYKASMNYLAFSRFMVLPLRGAEVPCGHVTLVSAMYLRKAIVVTDSAGVHDYVQANRNGLLCPSNDAQAMSAGMAELWNDPARAARLGTNGRAFAEQTCSDASVAAEMSAYFHTLSL